MTTVSPDTRATFRAMALGNGQAIEEVITMVYREIISSWSEPRMAIDGGAHIGYHTRKLGELDNVTAVVAIEANPATYEHHRRANGHTTNNQKIRLIHAALQDSPTAETVTFTTSTSHPGRSGIKPIMALYDKATTFEQPITVPATTVDKLASQYGKCGFIKLDLEGSEFAALRGGRETLLRDAPLCVLENAPDAPSHGGYAIEDFISYMQSVNMTLMTVYGEEMTPLNARDFWYAWAIPNPLYDHFRPIIIDKIGQRVRQS